MAIETPHAELEVPQQAFEEHIVDMDFHLNPDEETLMSYVDDQRLKDKLTTEYGMAPRKGKWDAAYAIKGGMEGLFTQGRAEIAEDVRVAAEQLAIDQPIVNAGINNLPANHHPLLKTAVARACNDYLLDRIVDEGLDCLMMVPQWDPDATVAEIERVGDEDGIAGAYGWFGPFNLWGDTAYDPVFEELEKRGLPLALHGSLAYWPQHTPIGDNMYTWTEILGFDWPVHAQVTVVNLIMSGVFDKFPDLKVVIQEGGHWWLPFMRYRMDEFYEDHPEDIQITPRKFEMEERYLDKQPSEYLRENVRMCTQPMALPDRTADAKALLQLAMAEDTFIYSSDWPHQTLDPATWAYTSPAFKDDDLREAVLSQNALDVLRL